MVKVTERFYINANVNNYILQEKTIIQDEKSQNYGKEIFKDLGYYASLESCLKGILKLVTREYVGTENENTVKELITELKLQTDFIHSLKLDI